MDFSTFLNEIQASAAYRDQLVYIRETPPTAARYAEPAAPLPETVAAMLRARGIAQLYTHQAAAIDAVRRGEDVLIVTGTASGKSLCYQAPLLELLLADPLTRSMLLFPTKALCQDQFLGFTRALEVCFPDDRPRSRTRARSTSITSTGVTPLAGVYDGDTAANLRRKLRDHANVLFTNPDMLHAGLMPQHARWAALLARLRVLVLDELHTYHGVFGSNMANLLRRFFRLCEHYGSRPQVIACSATIGNPRELAEELTGRPMTLIDDDGSPCGKRTYVFWNPPVVRGTVSRSRRSANVEAHELMALLVSHGVPTITFSKAKMTAEMIYRYVGDTLRQQAPHLANKIAAYRGGYLPEARREIERRLFTGELLGVSTTRALELGIDVGGLDASIIVGYPGTLSSFYQQAGRAGRRTEDALVVLVGLDTPTNQYVMSHPAYVFGRPVEEAVIDPDNPYVVTGHLRCATHEMPLPDADLIRFGPNAATALRLLQENMKVRHIGSRWFHAAHEIPQHEIPLRSFMGENVVIQDVETGVTLGEVDRFDAPPILHPEAIYLHQGDTYRVLTLDLDRNIASVKREETAYYTQPIGGTDVHHIDHCLREKSFGTGQACWGEVTTHFRTYGYEKVRFYELDAISRHGVELPYFVLETMALWIVPPEWLMLQVRQAGLDAHNGLRGVGYATRMLLPLFATSETRDLSHSIGAVNAPWNAIFIYERYPHGLGFTEKAYDRLHEIMPAVLEAVRQCPCTDGCPCCVGKPLRGDTVWNVERGEGAIPSKPAALMILEGLLAEGAELHTSDRQAFTDADAARVLRLEASLRRRLERMREPQVEHHIEPQVPTRYPNIEQLADLPKADLVRRLERRHDFNKELRKRVARHEFGDLLPVDPPAKSPAPPPAKHIIPSVPPPSAPPPSPPATAGPIELGDSLAAKARRLRRKRDE